MKTIASENQVLMKFYVAVLYKWHPYFPTNINNISDSLKEQIIKDSKSVKTLLLSSTASSDLIEFAEYKFGFKINNGEDYKERLLNNYLDSYSRDIVGIEFRDLQKVENNIVFQKSKEKKEPEKDSGYFGAINMDNDQIYMIDAPEGIWKIEIYEKLEEEYIEYSVKKSFGLTITQEPTLTIQLGPEVDCFNNSKNKELDLFYKDNDLYGEFDNTELSDEKYRALCQEISDRKIFYIVQTPNELASVNISLASWNQANAPHRNKKHWNVTNNHFLGAISNDYNVFTTKYNNSLVDTASMILLGNQKTDISNCPILNSSIQRCTKIDNFYKREKNYSKDDIIVYYNNHRYISLIDNNQFNDPDESIYWKKMEELTEIEKEVLSSIYDNNKIYQLGDIVISDKKRYYKSLINNNSNYPIDSSAWVEIDKPKEFSKYDSTIYYKLDDIVEITKQFKYQNLINGNLSQNPDDNFFWKKIESASTKERTISSSIYNKDYIYKYGDIVILNGTKYRNLINYNSGKNPEESQYWKFLIEEITQKEKDQIDSIYNPNKNYKPGDIVIYNYYRYRCKPGEGDEERDNIGNIPKPCLWEYIRDANSSEQILFESLYDSEIEYKKGSTVIYESYWYRSISNNNIDNDPLGKSGNAHWERQKELNEKDIETISLIYQPRKIYFKDEVIFYKNKKYKSLRDFNTSTENFSNNPEQPINDYEYWEEIHDEVEILEKEKEIINSIFNKEKEYSIDDIVIYNNYRYISLANNNKFIEKDNDDNPNELDYLLWKKRDKLTSLEESIINSIHSMEKTYNKNDVVIYNNCRYISLTDNNISKIPKQTGSVYWQPLREIWGFERDVISSLYDSNKLYNKDDIIIYNNIRYISLTNDNTNNIPTDTLHFYWDEIPVSIQGKEKDIISDLFDTTKFYRMNEIVISDKKWYYKSLIDDNTKELSDISSWEEISSPKEFSKYDSTKTYKKDDVVVLTKKFKYKSLRERNIYNNPEEEIHWLNIGEINEYEKSVLNLLYDPETNYKTNDITYQNYIKYVSITDNNIDHDPQKPFWGIVGKLDEEEMKIVSEIYDEEKIYNKDEIVICGSDKYRSQKNNNHGNSPEESIWNELREISIEEKDLIESIYDPNNSYETNDTIILDEIRYKSLIDNNKYLPSNSSFWKKIEITEKEKEIISHLYKSYITYSKDNIVFYKGNKYKSLLSNNIGKNPELYNEYWKKIEITNEEEEIISHIYGSTVSQSFNKNDIVIFSEKKYRSLKDNNKTNPIDGDWEKISNFTINEKIDLLRNFRNTHVYNEGDIVTSKGTTYKSLIDGNIFDNPDISPYWTRVNKAGFSALDKVERNKKYKSILVMSSNGDIYPNGNLSARVINDNYEWYKIFTLEEQLGYVFSHLLIDNSYLIKKSDLSNHLSEIEVGKYSFTLDQSWLFYRNAETRKLQFKEFEFIFEKTLPNINLIFNIEQDFYINSGKRNIYTNQLPTGFYLILNGEKIEKLNGALSFNPNDEYDLEIFCNEEFYNFPDQKSHFTGIINKNRLDLNFNVKPREYICMFKNYHEYGIVINGDSARTCYYLQSIEIEFSFENDEDTVLNWMMERYLIINDKPLIDWKSTGYQISIKGGGNFEDSKNNNYILTIKNIDKDFNIVFKK